MQRFSLFVILLLTMVTASFGASVTVTLKMQDCATQPKLFSFDGINFNQVQEATSQNDTYQFAIQTNGPRFYYIGENPGNSLILILGDEKNVQLQGNCNDFKSVQISNSTINAKYLELRNTMSQFNTERQNFTQQFYASMNDAPKQEEARNKLKELDTRKLALLDSLKKTQPYLARILAMNTYLSFETQTSELNEIAYFAKNFFKYADFADASLDGCTWVYESTRSYANTLASVGLNNEDMKRHLDALLEKLPKGSDRRQLALGGILAGMVNQPHDLYVPYAKQYMNEYTTVNAAGVKNIESSVRRIEGLTIGGEAPDFSQMTPEGATLSLKELRGQVVLLDFWASWCGPCRKENPNVVAAYQKYKDKGFTILSISLDNSRDRWLAAIAQDGMEWRHVSDLGGWNNEVAKLYGISSIPRTFLLDKNGRVIAKNLRGQELHNKLEEVLNTKN